MRLTTRRHAATWTLVALLATGALAPASLPALATEDLDDQIEDTEDELEDVSRTIAQIEAELQAVSDEVEALDRRLRAASAELAAVRADLKAAEGAVEAAREREADAVARLAVARDELARVEAELGETRARLELRLVRTFKHGTLTKADVIVRGTVGSLDLHELAVTMNAVTRMTDDDRDLVDLTTALAAEQRGLIDEVDAVRAEAAEAGQRAEVERGRTAELVAKQAEVVGRIENDRARRQQVLDALEKDSAVKAALAAKLQRQVAALKARKDAGVTNPGGPPPGAPDWAGRLPSVGQPYAELINNAAAAQGVDGRLMAALIWTESYFRPDAVSPVGAAGLAQLMPGTARGLGLRVDAEVDERFDPWLNANGGAKYLRYQLVRFGSVELALAAYNAGPTRVANCGCIPNITETQLYVVRVLDRYARIAG